MRDSNPGVVRMSLGGVGRNIAHNMALLGMDVRLLTVFGDDINAQKIAASCGELGIDISQSPVIPEGRTSTYLFITDERGDMALAVSDMEIYKHLTPQMLAQRQTLLNASHAVVLDTNLPGDLHAGEQLCFDTVWLQSVKFAQHRLQLHCFGTGPGSRCSFPLCREPW